LAAGAVNGMPGRSLDAAYTERDNGRADLYLESTREGQITAALTTRGRKRQRRSRSMSTRIRALVHDAVGASAVTPSG